jgi:sugar-specific transcriptional regulator TrmB
MKCGSLAARGDIIVSQDETPLYAPLPPEELVARHRGQAESVLDEAGSALGRYATTPELHEGIWNITGHDVIIRRVWEGIARAKQRILLEIWPDEAHELHNALREAAQRGVDVVIISYGDLAFDFARVFRSKRSEEVTEAYGGRWIVFSADNREVLTGICSLGAQSRAAWTSHPCLVMPIT